MALPTSRNKTYSGADPVRAADMNDIQDRIVAGAHGSKTLIVDASMMQESGGVWGFTALNPAPGFEPQWLHTAASNEQVIAPLPLHVNAWVTAVNVRCKLDTATAAAIEARLYVSDTATGVATAMSDIGQAAASTTRQTIALANIVAGAQVAGSRWFVVVTANAAIDKRLYSAEFTYYQL